MGGSEKLSNCDLQVRSVQTANKGEFLEHLDLVVGLVYIQVH